MHEQTSSQVRLVNSAQTQVLEFPSKIAEFRCEICQSINIVDCFKLGK